MWVIRPWYDSWIGYVAFIFAYVLCRILGNLTLLFLDPDHTENRDSFYRHTNDELNTWAQFTSQQFVNFFSACTTLLNVRLLSLFLLTVILSCVSYGMTAGHAGFAEKLTHVYVETAVQDIIATIKTFANAVRLAYDTVVGALLFGSELYGGLKKATVATVAQCPPTILANFLNAVCPF